MHNLEANPTLKVLTNVHLVRVFEDAVEPTIIFLFVGLGAFFASSDEGSSKSGFSIASRLRFNGGPGSE